MHRSHNQAAEIIIAFVGTARDQSNAWNLWIGWEGVYLPGDRVEVLKQWPAPQTLAGKVHP
jgi:hypothetical protein